MSSTPRMNQRPALCSQCGGRQTAGGICPRCSLRLGRFAGQDAAAGLMPTASHHGSGPAADDHELTPAELENRFPQYEVLHLIGRGGMGSVYRARQKSLDRVVAIKTIREADDDPTFAERFTREARALARLSHPHIVTIHDFGHSESLYYLVMEYVDGVNLRQAINARAFDPSDALRVVSQVCDALQYAHAQGVVHRDIKPENILLTETGDVKIADFGLAKMLGTQPSDLTLTQTRQVVGTPAYMAPEQIDRSAPIDHRADIYSLGVVFYELLTGQLPLGRFEPPSLRTEGIDRRIDPVVMKTLSRHPDERYHSAYELHGAVEHLSSSANPPATAAPPPPEPAPPFKTASAPQKDQPDWAATAAGPAPEPRGARSCVSFHCESSGGMTTARGLIHLSEQELFLEWHVRPLDLFDSGTESVRIPWERVAALQLSDYVVSMRLKITGTSLSCLGRLPTAKTGVASLAVSRSDGETLRPWIAWFEARRASEPATPGAPAGSGLRSPIGSTALASATPLATPLQQSRRRHGIWKVIAVAVVVLIVLQAVDKIQIWLPGFLWPGGGDGQTVLAKLSGDWATMQPFGGEGPTLALDREALPLRELRLEEGERLAIFALDPSAEESLSQYRDPESGALPERWSVRLDGGIELELRLAASDSSEAEPDSSNAEPDSAAAARLLRSQPLGDATWRQLQALQGRYQMRAAEK